MAVVQPLRDRVILKRIEEEQEEGGIIIPDAVKEKSQEAEVLAVGPGRWEFGSFIETTVKPGDIVLFNKYAGNETKHKDQEVIILREDDILAILH